MSKIIPYWDLTSPQKNAIDYLKARSGVFTNDIQTKLQNAFAGDEVSVTSIKNILFKAMKLKSTPDRNEVFKMVKDAELLQLKGSIRMADEAPAMMTDEANAPAHEAGAANDASVAESGAASSPVKRRRTEDKGPRALPTELSMRLRPTLDRLKELARAANESSPDLKVH